MKRLLVFFMACALNSHAQTCIPNTHSLTFNGSSADCITDNNLNITDSITVEAWIYATSWGFTSAQGSIVCKHSWSQQEQGYVLRAGGTGELSWNIAGLDTSGNPASWVEVVSPVNSLSLNTWYHVAGTYDGNVMNIYIDGVLVASTPFTGTIVAGSSFPLKIGRLADTGQFETRYWSGRIDEVRIWHRSLTQTEISDNMDRHIDPLTANNLAGYWRFNEGSGNTSSDLSSSGNDLSLSTQWNTTVPFNDAPSTPSITLIGFAITTNATGVTYQWLSGGNPVPGATQSSYTPVQSGMYSVMVTNPAGCTATSVSVNYIVGTEELNDENTFTISQDNSLITLTVKNAGLFKDFSIYDASGKCVLTQVVADESTSISTSALSSGIYNAVLTGKSENLVRRIFINR